MAEESMTRRYRSSTINFSVIDGEIRGWFKSVREQSPGGSGTLRHGLVVSVVVMTSSFRCARKLAG